MQHNHLPWQSKHNPATNEEPRLKKGEIKDAKFKVFTYKGPVHLENIEGSLVGRRKELIQVHLKESWI